MKKEATFVLERAPFTTKEGKEMYGYFVRGTVHGKEYKADFWRRTKAAMNCST